MGSFDQGMSHSRSAFERLSFVEFLRVAQITTRPWEKSDIPVVNQGVSGVRYVLSVSLSTLQVNTYKSFLQLIYARDETARRASSGDPISAKHLYVQCRLNQD